MNNNSKIKYLKYIIYLVPFFIFAWLINKHFVFSGNVKSEYGFGIKTSIMSEIKPSNRTNEPYQTIKNKILNQDIIAEPVYFDVNIPRMFDNASVTLTYEAPKEAIIELGVKKGPNPTDFYFETVQNYFYEGLDEEWNRIDDHDLKYILLQKGELDELGDEVKYLYNYDSLKGFLNNMPADKTIATYKFDTFNYLKIDNYQASSKGVTINTPIKGDHTMLTYIKNEDLNFEFDIYDANNLPGADILRVDLYQGAKLISSDIIEDDGNETMDGAQKILDKYNLYKPGLPEGLYKIVFSGSDDLIINKLVTAQTYLVFEKNISFLDTNKNVSVFAIDNQAKVRNENGIPVNVFLNNIKQVAEDEQTDLYLALDPNISNKITTLTSNTVSARYLVFSEAQFFDPSFGLKFTSLAGAKTTKDLDYIIMPLTEYTAPKKSGNKFIKTVNFEVGNAYVGNGPMEFIISVPTKDIFSISNIEISLNRSPIWNNFIPRLINKFNGN